MNVTINKPQIKYESLNDYEVIKRKNNVQERKNEIMEKLRKNFPNFSKSMLESICEEYTDIFGLESEKITCSNFYQQKLRVKDDTPVYIKNY